MERREVHRAELATGVEVEAGKSFELRLAEPKGELHIVVSASNGWTPVARAHFRVSGPHGVSFEGETDELGTLRRAEPLVPMDVYELAIVERTLRVHPVAAGDPPLQVRLIDWPPNQFTFGNPGFERRSGRRRRRR